MTLVPAYGRDYKSKGDAEKDFRDGKDFQIADISSPDDGRYCSVTDFSTGTPLNLRFKKLRSICVIKVRI